MPRETGTYRVSVFDGEQVRAFVPHPLPPTNPPLSLDDRASGLLAEAEAALGRLSIASSLVPSADWFIYGFVRKEAVISSQIEGTQATLRDVLSFEATNESDRPEDVEEVCNYIEALNDARRELSRPKGLPISARLLCGAHKRLMRGVRGADKQPGRIRTSQNWIGGSRPGDARFVPPPAESVPEAMAALEKWIHADDPLPPLVRAGLAHVQFETIHPFLDGNGRIGRLLIALLVEHWGLLDQPLLYLSVALKRRQQEYYQRLSAVRIDGDWEGWTVFFLECVREAADDGVDAAQRLYALVERDRRRLIEHESATMTAVRLLDILPTRPFITAPQALDALNTTKPTANKAIETLQEVGILRETTGRRRDRVYAYHDYLRALTHESD